MPFKKMPLSVQHGVKNKHKKGGSHKWMATYEAARKQGHSKESAAKIAYGALNKENLSLNSILNSLVEDKTPPGMNGMDRPLKNQTHPSVDVLGQKLQKLVAQLNSAQEPNQKAQLAAQ